LTARAFAELLRLPAYEQLRILQEQKYPSRSPQTFRTRFYAPALNAIRRHYEAGNDPAALQDARRGLEGIRLDSRRQSNARVLDAFEASAESRRRLTPLPTPRLSLSVGTLQIRLSLDFAAREADVDRRIYYNCRAAAVEPDTARTTLEIAHWILEETGTLIDPALLELVDLAGRRRYRGKARRPTTIRRVRQNARVIDALWRAI
jgi:hypothetical protein